VEGSMAGFRPLHDRVLLKRVEADILGVIERAA